MLSSAYFFGAAAAAAQERDPAPVVPAAPGPTQSPPPPHGRAPRHAPRAGFASGYGYYYHDAAEPPEKLHYREGDPIPPGYHPDTEIRTGLVTAGAVTLGSLHLASTIGAAIVGDRELTPLHAPVVGPFIAIGNFADDSFGALPIAVFVLDGLGQTAGLAMLIAGFAAQRDVLVRDEAAIAGEQVTVELAPMASAEGAGATLSGRF